MVNFKTERKGSALVMVLIIMLVLSILGAAIIRVAVAENTFAKRNEDKLQAYYIARSGAQAIAEYMIRNNNDDADEFIGKESEWNNQVAGGEFKVAVSKEPDSSIVSVTSIGKYNNSTQEAKLVLTGTPSGISGIFKYGMASKDAIYADVNKTSVVGDVASNNSITLKLKNGSHTGSSYEYANLNFPEIIAPSEFDLKLNNISNITNNGSGSEKLYVKAGKIDINGAVKISGYDVIHLYVEGEINFGGNSKFELDSDAKLYIYAMSDKNVTMTGNSGPYGSIFLYAPKSIIEFSSAGHDFKGSVIGKSIKLQNHINIKYIDMSENAELFDLGVGINYTGYKWID